MRCLALLLSGVLAAAAVAAEPSSAKRSIDELVQSLASPAAEARQLAALELAEQGTAAAAAVPALVARLEDEDPGVRAASSWALGRVGPAAKEAVPALVKRLADPGISPDGVPLGALAGQALGQIGPAAVPELVKALESSELHLLKGASVALGVMGPEAKDAVPALVAILEKPAISTAEGDFSPDSHGTAMSALVAIGPESKAAIPVLIKRLDDENFHTQYWACRDLAAIGPAAQPAVPALCRLLEDPVASVRRHAAIALGKIGRGIGEEGLRGLIAALEDPLEPVREDAVVALGRLGDFALPAVPAIEKQLAVRRLAARAKAARSLWQITGQTEAAVDILATEIGNPIEAEVAAETLIAIGPAARTAMPRLHEHLKSKDPLAQLSAAVALMKLDPGSKAAAAAIEELEKSEYEEVREDTARALERLKEPSAPSAP